MTTRPRPESTGRRPPGVPALLGAALILFAAGCDEWPGRPDPADRPVASNAVTDFDVLFQRSCAGCHGREGNRGPAPPLNDPLFLAIVSDRELERIIREGRRGTLMPGFSESAGGALTDEQIQILATGLKPKWGGDSPAPASVPPYLVSPGDARNGAKVFAAACAGCHGEDGRDGYEGPINDVAFLSLISDQALRRLIITGRTDLGMPDYADHTARDADFQPLSSNEIDDLVALLAEWRTGSGDRQLSSK